MSNWLYTNWNDNKYILFLLSVLLIFIIIFFKLLRQKKNTFISKSKFNNTDTPTTTTTTTTTTTQPGLTTTTQPGLTTTTQPGLTTTTQPGLTTTTQPGLTTTTQPGLTTTTQPGLTTTTQPGLTTTTTTQPDLINNKFIALYNNDEISYKINTNNINNINTNNMLNTPEEHDILQNNSNLYNQNTINNNTSCLTSNTDSLGVGLYASLDDLGKSMTDTIGGINSNLGYTVLQEQLGTFTPNYTTSNTYDNTQLFHTGLDPNTVDGVSNNSKENTYTLLGKNQPPIIMQKDFAGVANIFAPNIYISNPPLNSNGYPDISYSV